MSTGTGQKQNIMIGGGLSFLAAVFLTVLAFVAKGARNEGFGNGQILMWRSIAQFVIATLLVFGFRESVVPAAGYKKGWKPAFIFWFQAFMNVFSFYAYVGLMNYFSVGVATVIFYISPIYSGVFGKLILGDAYTIRDLGVHILCVAGLVLACYQEFADTFDGKSAGDIVVAFVFFVLAPATNALAAIGLRMMDEEVHVVQPQVASGIMGVILGGLISLIIPSEAEGVVGDQSWKVWVCLVGAAMCSSAGMMSLHVAVQHIPAALAVLITTAEVPLVYIYEIAFEGVEAKALGIIGAVIVTAACCLGSFVNSTPEAAAPQAIASVPMVASQTQIRTGRSIIQRKSMFGIKNKELIREERESKANINKVAELEARLSTTSGASKDENGEVDIDDVIKRLE